jgi:phosphatidylserine synthase
MLSETNPSVRFALENAVFYSLPIVTICLAVLMVSRIRYPHVLNQYIRGKKPFAQFIRLLLVLGLIIWGRQAALVLIFCGFAASGFLKWFYYRVIKKSPLLVTEQQGSLSTAEGPTFENDAHSPGGAG